MKGAFTMRPALPGNAILVILVTMLGWACAPRPLPGAEAAAWWQRETAMKPGGILDLKEKPWWPRAKALKPGERLSLQSDLPGGGRMLVRRETVTRGNGKQQDAIVWIIDDDDGDMRPDAVDGDTKNDCYVVDYDGDGLVDRMVDYIDNDDDGKPDEMEIRYYQDGQLRIAWFGVDLDHRGRTWNLAGYEYWGGFFRSYPYGNTIIYANRYDPEQDRWWPISECPFAFHDAAGRGQSEAVVRISAVPLDFDPLKEADLGNAGFNYRVPFGPRFRNIGAVNVRYGIDVDGLRSPERPLHYDCGFNLIGRVPYEFPGMAHENPLRRAPKTTCFIPHADTRRLAETYPAEQTGFSWREYGDPMLKIGDKPHPEECRRWEGVFWTWHRRIMHDTGGPIQDWNTRREFRGSPSTCRELYYCRADRRIHLKGASEGWTKVGHLGDGGAWGEIRMFDINGDGYFDRWETYRAGSPSPVRVSTVADAGIRDLPHDWDQLQRVYVRELLPEALAANGKLIDAMRPLCDYRLPANLDKALKACTCDSERQYVQDIIREEHYLALREKLQRQSAELLAPFEAKVYLKSANEGVASGKAWEYAVALARLDSAYAEGRYDDAVTILRKLARIDEARPSPSSRSVSQKSP
jgi:hypothetical protein